MRRITLWLLSTVAAVVLAFSYRTSTMGPGGSETAAVATVPPSPSETASPRPTASPSPTASASPTGGPSASASTAPTEQSGDGTFDGETAQTRWGPVQVTITVSGGRITDVTVPTYPNGNFRDQEINAYALPTLRQETLDAQSADIDTVSGATVTSDGYQRSLQSAIDAAHLK
jgi:uncharacterized protein with FMN-binding domain